MGTIGDRIHDLRKAKGLTLEQLGALVGVGKSTVRKWETGHIQNMRRDKIAKLADALNVQPDYLMGWTNEKEKQPGNNAELSDLQKQAVEFVLNLSDDQLMKFIKLGKALID